MNVSDKIYIAGHNGMVGSAILRKLQQEGYRNIVCRSSAQLDLRNQQAVTNFFKEEKPQFVFVAAAKVGGIVANNTYRATFLYDNLMIQNNIIHAAYENGVEKLLFLGSSCIYPKLAPQPLKETYLLTGELEPTNEPYAIAKIAGIKMCDAYRSQYGCNFISAMPTNLYGTNDNYNLETSHVLPALIRKFHEAKLAGSAEVVLWGSGTPLREFLHADDLAAASYFLMQHYNAPGFINVGYGEDLSIKNLALMISKIVGYSGKLVQDTTKPDGTPRKLMDSTTLFALGWKPVIDLETGIRKTYEEFKNIYSALNSKETAQL
jgi:GDP-L-fucose synthase